MPLVLRMVSGGGVRLGAQHSQSLEALFAHIPGLVVAMPSNPFDAKGLLAAAIQDDNPVIFLEQKLLFFDEPTPVPEERYAIELGKARICATGHRRDGRRARGARSSGAAGRPRARRGGDQRRGARSADARPARRRDDRGLGCEDAPRRRRPRGGAVLRLRLRDRRARRRALLLGPRRAGRTGRRPSHPIPYQKDLELATLPGAAEIAAAVRSLYDA